MLTSAPRHNHARSRGVGTAGRTVYSVTSDGRRRLLRADDDRVRPDTNQPGASNVSSRQKERGDRTGIRIELDVVDGADVVATRGCLLYTSPSPRDRQKSRMPS